MEGIIDDYLADKNNKKENLDTLAKLLVSTAVKDGTKDNTTAMIIELNKSKV